MESITLSYGSGPTSQTLKALSVKGFDPVDELEDFPNIIHPIIDGGLVHQSTGIRRHFTIELEVGQMQVYATRLFVANFWKDPIKYLTYTHDGITETSLAVVRSESGELTADWVGGVSLARLVTLELREKNIRTSFPT